MSFTSPVFFLFFAVVLLLARVIRNGRAREYMLLAASYVFYGWLDIRLCLLLALLTLVTYFAALRQEKRPRAKLPLLTGILVPLAVLAVFKYLNFFLDSLYALFGSDRSGALRILLPAGISFYTFQSISYAVDVRRGKLRAQHDFADLALYMAFFPRLTAGPIQRAGEFFAQLERAPRPTGQGVWSGLTLFFAGLFKKAVLSDHIAVFVDAVYATPASYGSATVWLAVIAYSFQIYLDFSGYSDMAAGCARCLGYELPRNFDLPYLSRNVTEFWRRWHISLSTWLRDYLYIPLGGSRRGFARTLLNLFLTMLLGGLWHGAGLCFILWGALHGLALCVHKCFMKKRHAAAGNRLAGCGSTLLTFLFVTLAWVLFRAEDMSAACGIFARLFSFSGGVAHPYTWAFIAPAVTLAWALYCARCSRDENGGVHVREPAFGCGTFTGTLLFALLIAFTLILMYTGETQFIYLRF